VLQRPAAHRAAWRTIGRIAACDPAAAGLERYVQEDR
jgi:hypothetical protein